MSLIRSIDVSQDRVDLEIDLELLGAQREADESQDRYDFNEVAHKLREKLITK